MQALAEADRIRGAIDGVEGEQVVADFARYAAAARPMRPAHDGEADRTAHRRPGCATPAGAVAMTDQAPSLIAAPDGGARRADSMVGCIASRLLSRT
jgi:hypothetical protein